MHELSIAVSIIDIAAEESERHGGAAVKAVHLQLGPLAGVVREALLSAFVLAREESVLASSDLVIEEMPLVVFCRDCQAERTLAPFQDFCCPECGVPCGDVVSGR